MRKKVAFAALLLGVACLVAGAGVFVGDLLWSTMAWGPRGIPDEPMLTAFTLGFAGCFVALFGMVLGGDC
jgi:amino acid transporter